MYENYPSYDLSDRKDFIKKTVKEVKTLLFRKLSIVFCSLLKIGMASFYTGFNSLLYSIGGPKFQCSDKRE